jgi:hypothetical protein
MPAVSLFTLPFLITLLSSLTGMYNWCGLIPLSSFDLELRPPPRAIQQHSILIKFDSFTFQQLTLLVDIDTARRVPPFTLKTAYVAGRGDTTMAGL